MATICHSVSVPAVPTRVGRGWTKYLVGAGDDGGERALLLPRPFDHGLNDAGVVRSQIDKTVGDAGVP